MPRRVTHVRVSVQHASQEKGWANTKAVRWSHMRWQKLKSLFPTSGRQVFEDARAGNSASWRASARALPALKDGWRLVSIVDNEVESVFEILKVVRRGRMVDLYLEEKSRQQDGVQGPNQDAGTDEYEIPTPHDEDES